ncbi:hypothetical protein [Streptomyces sp. NPDC002537]
MKAVRYLVAPLAVGTALTVAFVPVSAAVPKKRITLTYADNGRKVEAHLGDDTEVRLTGYREHGLTYTWSVPAADGTAVLRRTAGAASPGGGASAVFHAEHRGTATITAQRRCHSDPGRLCPLVVVPWKVTVEVK